METRNISLTLEKAKEWYNSGNADLKEIALQAYTEKELNYLQWENIKTFEDACKTINIPHSLVVNTLTDTCCTPHMRAVFKIDIIRAALNGNWKPDFNNIVYYPLVRYDFKNKAIKTANINNLTVKEIFKVNGKEFQLIGGDYQYDISGLGEYDCNCSNVCMSPIGLFACKSKEIAQHMSRYFAKEIFDACYVQHNIYEWV